MKYSKTAIGLLTAQYRSVLKKCWLINVGLFFVGAAIATPAQAGGTVNVISNGTEIGSGNTIGTVNLSTYATTSEMETALAGYTTTAQARTVAGDEITNQLASGGDIYSAISNAKTAVMSQVEGKGYQTLSQVQQTVRNEVTGEGSLALHGASITTTGAANIGGAITASGNISTTGTISSTGNITSNAGTVSGKIIKNVDETFSVTAAGSVTASGNIKSTTGNVQAGSIVLNGSDDSITGVSSITATGNISTAGNITANGAITASSLTTDYDIVSTNGSVKVGDNSVFATLNATDGSITSTGDITTTTGNITATAGNIVAGANKVVLNGSTGSISATSLTATGTVAANELKVNNSNILATTGLKATATDVSGQAKVGSVKIGSTSYGISNTGVATLAAGSTVGDSDIVTTDGTQTLTNKTIDAANNEISGIANANIADGAAIASSKIAFTDAQNTVFDSGINSTLVGKITANATAITGIQTAIGDVADLETTATDLVGGINEVKGTADANASDIADIESVLGSTEDAYEGGPLSGKTFNTGETSDISVADAFDTINSTIGTYGDIVTRDVAGTFTPDWTDYSDDDISDWVDENGTKIADVNTTDLVLTKKFFTVQHDLMDNSENDYSIAHALVGDPATGDAPLTLSQAVADVAINQAYNGTADAYEEGSVGEQIQTNTADIADIDTALGSTEDVYGDGPLSGKTFNTGDEDTDISVADAFESLNSGVDVNADAIGILNGDSDTDGSVQNSIRNRVKLGDNESWEDPTTDPEESAGTQVYSVQAADEAMEEAAGGAIAALKAANNVAGETTTAWTGLNEFAQGIIISNGATAATADDYASSTLTATKDDTGQWLNISGNALVGGNFQVTGDAVLDGKLSFGEEETYANSITSSMINIDNQDANTLATAKAVYDAIGHVDGLVTEDDVTHVRTFHGTSEEGLISTNVTTAGNYVGNLASGTDVARDLVTLDNAVGNLNFTDVVADGNINTNYLNGNTSVGESLVDLDGQVKTNEDGIADIETVLDSHNDAWSTGPLNGKKFNTGVEDDDVTVADAFDLLNTGVADAQTDASYAKTAVTGVAGKVGGQLAADGTYSADSYSSVNNYDGTDTVIRAIGGVDMAVGDIDNLNDDFLATNLVGAANELMSTKQAKLTLNNGLMWDDNDETKMSVKLADGSGLAFDSTTKGLKIKVGDSMSVSNEGYLNIKYGSEFTADSNGLMLQNLAVTGAKIADNTITFGKLNNTAYSQTIGDGSDKLLATTLAVKDYVEDYVEEEAENGSFTGTQVNNGQGDISIMGALSATNVQVDKNTARFGAGTGDNPLPEFTDGQTVADYVKANAAYGSYDSSVNYGAGTIGAAIGGKQDALTAGNGIDITSGVISAKIDTGLEFDGSGNINVKTAETVATGNTSYVTSGLLADQGYQNEDQVNDLIEEVTGDLTTLSTEQKGTLVAAINEVDGHADAAQAAADEANNTIGAGAITAGTAGSLTTKVIGDNATGGEITVRDAIETLNATNVQENNSMNSIAQVLNGATVNANTGAYDDTGAGVATLDAGFTATNVTAAANELLGKITVPENDPGESYNFIQAGSNVANNLILLDQNIGSHDGKIDSLAGVISGHFDGDDFIKDDYGSENNIAETDSLTTAIGKLDAVIGDADDLETTAGTVVGAINEVKDTADAAAETAGKANNTATGVAQKLGGTIAEDGTYTAAPYGDTLYNITNSDTVIDAVGKLDGAMGKLTDDGNYIKEDKNFAQNLVILDGQVYQNAQDIDGIESLIGSTPKIGHGILDGKTITGATGEGNLTIVDAIDYVAQNAAGLHTDNEFTGTNTFGTTDGSQVIITNGGSMTVDHDLTVGDKLTIGAANAISSTEDGKLDMGGNALENVNGLTLTNGTDHTHDATISVGDNGIEMDKSVNINGSITATGIDTSEDNKVKLGGTGYTTEVTGDLTVSGKSTLNELEVTGDTLLANTTVDGTLDVSGKATFGDANGSRIEIEDGALTVRDDGGDQVAVINNDGTASFKGTSVDGDLTVTGDANISGGLSAADGKFAVNGDTGTITMSDGGAGDDENTATMGMTQIEVQNGTGAETIKNVVKVDGNGLFTGDVASEKGFVIATQDDPANPYIIQYQVNDKGEINAAYDEDHNRFNFTVTESGATTMQDTLTVASGGADITGDTTIKGKLGVGANGNEFQVSEKGEISGVGITTSEEDGVSLGVEEKPTEIIGSTVDITADDSASIKAGANGIDVTAAAGENPGGTNVTGNFSVGEDKFTVAGDTGNTAIAGTLDVTGLSSLDGGINVNDKFTVDTEGNTQAESLAFNGDQQEGQPAVLVNSIDQGAEAITDGEVSDTRKETMATVATVAKTIGNLASKKNLNANGITNVDDVAEAIGSLAKNVKDATGGEFADDGEWTGTVTGEKEVNYAANVDYHDLISAIDQVSSNIGRETTVANNGAQAGATVNENIDAINTRIGDVDTMVNEYKNLSNGSDENPATVVEALQNVDASMGTIHGLSDKLGNKYQGNLAEGNGATVEAHLTAIDAAIGNRARFAETHYATNSKDVVDAITKVDNGLYHLDQDVRDLRHHFEAGMASAAALSALVPNARAHGDTQLSLGTGAYRGHGAIAVGGFHWFTDNLLMNAGVAWDNNEATYRMGVTYSF